MRFFYSVCNKKINVSYCILNSKLNYFNLSTLSAFFLIEHVGFIFPNMYAKDLLNYSEHVTSRMQRKRSESFRVAYLTQFGVASLSRGILLTAKSYCVHFRRQSFCQFLHQSFQDLRMLIRQ